MGRDQTISRRAIVGAAEATAEALARAQQIQVQSLEVSRLMEAKLSALGKQVDKVSADVADDMDSIRKDFRRHDEELGHHAKDLADHERRIDSQWEVAKSLSRRQDRNYRFVFEMPFLDRLRWLLFGRVPDYVIGGTTGKEE